MPGVVIAISSQVARGAVGNRAMVFALERLGFTVWTVPTLLLTHHPGHGATKRIVPADDEFERLVQSLVVGERAAEVAGIVTGYLATPAQARSVATLVRTVKAARPDLIYLCDPVIGDGERLYVPEPVAEAIRSDLLPIADIATPNVFECRWLAGSDDVASDLATLARRLAPPAVLVTSAPAMVRGQIGNLLVTDTDTILFEHRLVSTPVKGTGDLLAALLLARRLEGQSLANAAETVLASILEIVAGSSKAGADELLLAEFQDSLPRPHAVIDVRRLAAALRADRSSA